VYSKNLVKLSTNKAK